MFFFGNFLAELTAVDSPMPVTLDAGRMHQERQASLSGTATTAGSPRCRIVTVSTPHTPRRSARQLSLFEDSQRKLSCLLLIAACAPYPSRCPAAPQRYARLRRPPAWLRLSGKHNGDYTTSFDRLRTSHNLRPLCSPFNHACALRPPVRQWREWLRPFRSSHIPATPIRTVRSRSELPRLRQNPRGFGASVEPRQKGGSPRKSFQRG